MTEDDLLRAVLDLARIAGFRSLHLRPGLNRRGFWTTAIQGDGVGWPDLLLVKPQRIVAAELKGDKGDVTAAQRSWLIDLEAAGVETHIWRPANLRDGSIARVLGLRVAEQTGLEPARPLDRTG